MRKATREINTTGTIPTEIKTTIISTEIIIPIEIIIPTAITSTIIISIKILIAAKLITEIITGTTEYTKIIIAVIEIN